MNLISLILWFAFIGFLLIGVVISDVPNQVSGSSPTGNKIAFLFLTRGPMPLEPVWDAFFHWNVNPSEFSVFIHPHNDYQYTSDSFFYGHEVRTEGATVWGALSVTSAIQAMMRKALEDPLNTWFTLMSEACIPLHPFQQWKRALMENNLSVVNACPHDDDPRKSEDMTEIRARWRSELEAAGVKREQWRKSATWFALNRKHAQIFADDSKVLNAFINVPIPDEHYISTLLAHHGLDNETECSDGFMHHLFTPTGSHPKTYGPEDISPRLFKEIDSPQGKRGFGMTCSGRKTLCHFTARKFNVHSLFQLCNSLELILGEDAVPFAGPNPLQKRIRADSNGSFYLLVHGELMWLPLNAIGDPLGLSPENVTKMSTEEMNRYSIITSPFPKVVDGEIVKTKHNPQVYLIMGYSRFGIDSMEVFQSLGLSFGNLRIMPDHEISILPEGEAITTHNLAHWKPKVDAAKQGGLNKV